MDRKTGISALIVLFFLISVGMAQQSIGKITFPIGNNFLQQIGDVQWNPVKYYMPVRDKDRIKTGKQSRCEITFS
ncbi:MAG: hypothetical protein GXO77_08025, partial [Calditrichaeota bacterium]|nr:hypothetical protein [Calditrichota bacterium]